MNKLFYFIVLYLWLKSHELKSCSQHTCLHSEMLFKHMLHGSLLVLFLSQQYEGVHPLSDKHFGSWYIVSLIPHLLPEDEGR